MYRSQNAMIAALASVFLIGAGCAKKKTAAITPPQPAPVAAQTPSAAPAPERNVAAAPTPAPEPRYPDARTRARIDELLAKIEDAYFDYDTAAIRPDALKALTADSTELRDILVQYPDYKLTIQGFCDERGSEEYNLGLGDRRAAAAKDYLVNVGIPASQLSIISFGKERPVCTEHNEACWQKNRRIHIMAMAKEPQS